jgi:tyrosine-specific transport protein
MTQIAKVIGSTLILIGTAIGAGMLALPMSAAAAGFGASALLIIFMWALMTLTALLVLEVTLALPLNANSFQSMAYHTLGKGGQAVAWVTCLVLLYALTAAYTAGNGSLLTQLFSTYLHHTVNPKINSIVFLLVFGSIVFWSTHLVDIVNRWLMGIKGLFLVLMLILLLPHVNVVELMQAPDTPHTLLAAIPIFLTAFGFHTVIPSLTNYLGKEAKVLKYIIIVGAIVPLAIYLLWLLGALGTLPMQGEMSYTSLHAHGAMVGEFIGFLSSVSHSRFVTFTANGFANIAMTTSFLGVSLGLFDFLADAFKRHNHRVGRLQTAVLTFVPPLIFALFYPKGFIMALSYAGICVAILEVILPAAMAFRLRRQGTPQLYRVTGGTPLLLLVGLMGVVLIGLFLFLG